MLRLHKRRIKYQQPTTKKIRTRPHARLRLHPFPITPPAIQLHQNHRPITRYRFPIRRAISHNKQIRCPFSSITNTSLRQFSARDLRCIPRSNANHAGPKILQQPKHQHRPRLIPTVTFHGSRKV